MYDFIVFNNDMVHKEEAGLPVGDIALGRGYGVFDYFQVRNGIPLYMEDHINRFRKSCGLMRLNVEIDDSLIRQQVSSLLSKNNVENAGIKLLATGGVSKDGFSMGEGNLLIITYPYYEVPEDMVRSGVKLLSYEHQRMLPHIKTINYIYAVYLFEELKAAGAIEPLYYTQESVRETARSNIMAVIDGQIIAPHKGILEGITRRKVVSRLDLDIIERDITIDELKNADEVFLVGTTKRALGVVQIDDQTIGNGKPGPVTHDVRSRLLSMEKTLVEAT